MRKVEYLSPTAVSLFYSNPEEYYLRYLASEKQIPLAQTNHMSVGSSFDAHAKSYLYEMLFGKGHNPKFDLIALFEAQVESHNRDSAYEAGKYVFEQYKSSGALSDLAIELQNAIGNPRFEIEIKGVVNGYREGITLDIGGITLLGKPDLFYINRHGAHVILDWKVNGYYSKYPVSPAQGYIRIREPGGHFGNPHKNCHPMTFNGMMINIGCYLEQVNMDWANQLAVYGWLCGEEIGQEFITAIDQIVCKPVEGRKPTIRVAEHRCRISSEHQFKTFARIQKTWEIIHSNHFFRDLSLEDSIARCKILDEQVQALAMGNTDQDEWFRKMAREVSVDKWGKK